MNIELVTIVLRVQAMSATDRSAETIQLKTTEIQCNGCRRIVTHSVSPFLGEIDL